LITALGLGGGSAWAALGQPVDWQLGLQDAGTPVMEDIVWFHDYLLLGIITAIALFVLVLLLIIMVRFNATRNPTPSRTTHNTLIEVLWTAIPVLILVVIAIPSFKLLFYQLNLPPADVTVKATGNQWFWSYTYPDNGNFEFNSILVPTDKLKPGQLRLLTVDNEMVVPVNKVVRVQTIGADVIHAFAVPSFGIKIDSVPGRLNETWFKTDRPGLYYGQCYELCGARHAYMPIAVEVVSPAQFAAWVASKGGTMPGANPPTGPDSTAASPTATPGPAPAGGTEATPEPTLTSGTATPPVTNQAAATPRGN
jgi:cytochrome c oxidase subunit 2